MENLTEKLNIFSELVLRDATQKRDELIAAVENERNKRLTQKENEFLQRAYDEIQSTITEAKKESNSKLLRAQLDAKKQLLIKREQIVDDVMGEAERKLRDFCRSAEYEKWFKDLVNKALFEVGKGMKTVYISPDDLKFKPWIEDIVDTAKITVEAAHEHDFIGGVRVYNSSRRVAADYSFGELLAEQKEKFLRENSAALN